MKKRCENCGRTYPRGSAPKEVDVKKKLNLNDIINSHYQEMPQAKNNPLPRLMKCNYGCVVRKTDRQSHYREKHSEHYKVIVESYERCVGIVREKRGIEFGKR